MHDVQITGADEGEEVAADDEGESGGAAGEEGEADDEAGAAEANEPAGADEEAFDSDNMGMGVMSAGLPAVASSSASGMPIRQYLDTTVVPILRLGLRELVKNRPEDPYNFLADYIRNNKPK
eukprot:363664-Chlamydomonas_euryale.AAC.10